MCRISLRTTLKALVQREEVMTMINWDSDNWGGRVHYASDGSWVADKHGDEGEHQEQ
jgi:hypothetical protein